MDGVVAPVDQVLPVGLLDVKVMLALGHSTVVGALMEAVKGVGLKINDPVCLHELILLEGSLGS